MGEKMKKYRRHNKTCSNGKRVLIIGGDHDNTLASVRALSRDGIAFDLIIHGDCSKNTMVGSSNAAPALCMIEESYESIDRAIRAWIGSMDPALCIILPSSDLSALVVDEQFRPLGVLCSGFENGARRICDLMDKNVQRKWAATLGIRVARGDEIMLDEYIERTTAKPPVNYPLIVKPVLSAEGNKSDITICQDQNEYVQALNKFKSFGYHRVLVQELIRYKYEIACLGVIRKNGSFVWRAYAKDAVHPAGCGSMVMGHLEVDKTILRRIEAVISTLAMESYRGLFDIDFFVLDGSIILNEINFRQSGVVAFPFYEGLYFPSIWARDLLGAADEKDNSLKPASSYSTVVEDSYLYYSRRRGHGVISWVKAMAAADGRTLIYPGDWGPFWFIVRKTLANQSRKLIEALKRGVVHGHA